LSGGAQVTQTAHWSDPTVEEVADGVFRIPLPLPTDGLRAVNVYLIDGDEGPVCIDSGWAVPEGREAFVNALSSIRRTPADIGRYLVTHIHRDHYTQAVVLRREFESKISLGANERDSLEALCDPSEEILAGRSGNLRRQGASELASALERLHQGQPMHATSEWEMPDEWLRDGDVVDAPGRRLRVVETPGHTRGHVVYHDEASSILFAGDHVLSTITPSIGFEFLPTANPLGDFLRSLARVRELSDALLLPAHGPVTASVHRRVDELVGHHAVRLDQAVAAVRSGEETAFEVAKQLHWTRRDRTFDELDLFNQLLAVSETAAHLKLLEAQGRLHSRLEDGVVHYAEGESADPEVQSET
jgi:glyoxylase-like metal-dependent hydrolase (beta-lactamase superfamily II)